MAYKNHVVPAGKGLSHQLVSVVLARSCSFEWSSVDRSKSSNLDDIYCISMYERPKLDVRG